MKYKTLLMLAFALLFLRVIEAQAQFNLGKLKVGTKTLDAVKTGAKGVTFTNEDAIKLSKQSVGYMDTHNPIAAPDDPYTERLERLFSKHMSEDGLALNFKVYKVKDLNAFACADGSVRVFSSLMDIMTDNELLAVIGHEIGHVKNEDTKKAMKAAYMRTAVKDAASSQSDVVRTISESELGSFTESYLNASHSRGQEAEADNYAYNFLKRNKYNVMGEYTAFKKLALLSSGASPTHSQKMLSSHPDSESRAASVKQKAEADGLWKDPGVVKLPTEKLHA